MALMPTVKQIKFFKERRDKIDKTTLQKIIQKAQLLSAKKGDTIVKEGEMGELFYIILHG